MSTQQAENDKWNWQFGFDIFSGTEMNPPDWQGEVRNSPQIFWLLNNKQGYLYYKTYLVITQYGKKTI